MNMDIDFTRRNKKPRPLSEAEKDKLEEFVESIHYSARCARIATPAARRERDRGRETRRHALT